MKKVGEHVTIDFLGVKQDYSPDFYSKVIYKIAKKTKVEVLNIAEHRFKPQGFTCVALLAESHMSFHTFPEHRIISFDFFTCGKITPSVALEIIKNEIEHKRIIKKEFNSKIPNNYDDLINLPGIGDYTTKAILGIAYNKSVMPIDVNIERILARLYGLKLPIIKIKKDLRKKSDNFISKNSSSDLIIRISLTIGVIFSRGLPFINSYK